MQTEQLIQVDTFCIWHDIEFSFINSLHEHGLIEITTKDNKAYIPESDLARVERMIRLFNDLEVNLEGVEVITYLLEQLNHQQEEITLLQNKLRFYEL